MAITNKDIEKLTGHFATKIDLERFATKEDLKQLEDKMIIRLDKILSEQEKAKEDRIFAKAKDDEQDRKIADLDRKLEEHVKLPYHSGV